MAMQGEVSQTIGPVEVTISLDLTTHDLVELYFPSNRHQLAVGDTNGVELGSLLVVPDYPSVLTVTLLGFADVPHAPMKWRGKHAWLEGTDAATVAEVLAAGESRGLRPLTAYEGLFLAAYMWPEPDLLTTLCLGLPFEGGASSRFGLKILVDSRDRFHNDIGLWETSIPCWSHVHFAMCEV